MPVNNRDLGTGSARESYQYVLGAGAFGASGLIATGATLPICVVPFPAQVAALQVFGFGLSGTPTVLLDVTRYNSGGVTTITGAISTLTVLGATISQAAGATISSGASLVSLQQNDIINFRTGTASTAMTGAVVTLVLQALQDIKTHFGN